MNSRPPGPSAEKLAEWQARASRKAAIVPEYFEVFPNHVLLDCGGCRSQFQRPLVPGIDEPVFVCPECKSRNWVPVIFDLK